MTAKFLHGEIREKGGAYGGGARMGRGGLFSFYSYRYVLMYRCVFTYRYVLMYRCVLGAGSPMLRTEGRGLESRLCQGLSLAGSRWSDIIGSSLRGRGGGLSNLDSRIRCASYEPGVTVTQMRGCGLEKAYHSLDR